MKVLDVGCGSGKWAFLVHDIFDSLIGGAFKPTDWRIDCTGIEIHEPYVTDLQRLLYKEILIEDALAALPKLGQFDLAIVGDIIEHFEKEKGHGLLASVFEHTDDIIISTPLGYMPQGAAHGNVHETHRSGWTTEDLDRYTVVEQRILTDEIFTSLAKFADPRAQVGLGGELRILVAWLRKK